MKENQGTQATLLYLGKILFVIGVIYMVFGLFPYVYASYKKSTSESRIEAAEKEIRSLVSWRESIRKKELSFPIRQKRKDNPRWMDIVSEREQYKERAHAIQQEKIDAKKSRNEASRTMDSRGIHAGLSAALTIAGVILILVARRVATQVGTPVVPTFFWR